MTLKKTGKILSEYSLLTAATLVMNLGIYVFKYPNNFSFGGVSGLSVVLAKLTGLGPSTLNLVINMVLLVLGFLFLGRGFAFKTVYVSLLSSIGLSVMEKTWPLSGPVTDQPVLELIFAIFLPGAASAVLFNMGASSGGTDIVAMIIKKYRSLEIGTSLFVVDCLIAVSAFFVFDVQTGLFSLCGLLAKSLVIDGVIESINACKYFNIVCDRPEPICDYICHALKKDATVYRAEGAFTKRQKYVILTAMKRSQAVELRRMIKESEPTAFILISTTSEIIGKGFQGFD